MEAPWRPPRSSMEIRELRGGLHEGLHGGPWSSVEVSMEVRGGLMEVPMEASTELHGASTDLLYGGLHGGP